MSFFTPPPNDPMAEMSELFEGFLNSTRTEASELLKNIGGSEVGELLKKLLPQPDDQYRAAVHTRPKKNPDGTDHPHEFEAVMALLKGSDSIKVDGQQTLTQELADAYMAAAQDALSSALYEAGFIKYSREQLKVPLMALMGQLDRFRKEAAAREDQRLLLRYRPSASIEGVPTVNVYYVREGVEVPIGHWHIPGVMAHLMQIQHGMECAARHERFSHELEDVLEVSDLDQRHIYIQGIQRTMVEIIENETRLLDLYEGREVD